MTARKKVACITLAAAAVSGGGTLALGATSTHVAKLSADPNGDLKFNTRKLTVKHGVVALVMKNPTSSGQQHGIAIAGKHGKSGKIVNPGGTSKVKLTLKPGKYTFYCPVPGHRAAGMRGTLTVK
jgi:uncharacterized cupredoxin-like copper-binding protein